MRGQIGTAGEVMQAIGAAIAAIQVLLFGLSERAHLERETPGDRLAAWLACHTATREAFTTAAYALRGSPTFAARIVYWCGVTTMTLIALVIMYGYIALFVYVVPLILKTGETGISVPTSDTGNPLVDLVVFIVGGVALIVIVCGSGFAVLLVLFYVVAPRLGRRLLPVLNWLGRNLEVSLRWSVFLFGLGAVLAVVG